MADVVESNGAESAGETRFVPRLRRQYDEVVVPGMTEQFGYKNRMMVPKVSKIVINVGMGEAVGNAKSLDNAVGDLTLITGQKPVLTRAKRSIAQFKVRQGMAIGVVVTLRGPRMYEFMDRLMNVALPRVRDFRGVPVNAFDGRGNYTLGLKEQLIFPEIDYDKIDRVRGMEISFVTTAKTDAEGRRLLELLGMPYTKPPQTRAAS